MNFDEQILHNLLIERELCIAKIEYATKRLDQLEELIDEQRGKLANLANIGTITE